MVNLSFDNGTVQEFTIVLSQRDYTHLGQIVNIRDESMKFKANLNDADELSFEVCKVLDGIEERLWDDIYDLRLVWIKELDEYFEIQVESIDQVYVTKTITAKSLCESELSQTYLHNIEINTAEDIARPDYDENYPTVFYRPEGDTDEKMRKASLLHRILEKVPAYTIVHVDESLIDLQRIFSISNSSVYDFLTGDCSEQFNCLFKFDSATRGVYVYDLYTVCLNPSCQHRGDFRDVCPKCGGTNLKYFGEDTTVFVSTENLTDEIKFETDVDSLKNCFRLEAGDDDMTAAVINSNPNGTQYIYEFNDDSKKDMPKELVDIIDEYDSDYDDWNNTNTMPFPSTTEFNTVLSDFNSLCDKYNDAIKYHKIGNPWKQITLPIIGYINLIPHYYNCIDFAMYLKSVMMPPVDDPATDVPGNIATLTDGFTSDSNIGFSVKPTTVDLVESTILNVAKLYVNTGAVKLKLNRTSWSWASGSTTGSWVGTITVTSYTDDSQHDDTGTLSLTLTTDYPKFMEQKINKQIKRSKESAELYDVLNKNKTVAQFTEEIKYYCANRLQSFHDAIQAVLGILIEAGQGITTSDLYSSFYTPYYQKLQAAERELDLRNSEISTVYGLYNSNGTVQTKGMIQYITDVIYYIQNELNFKEYINTRTGSYDLYNVYTTYIREDTYSNSNYISDDLNNDQLFENAGRFMELAKQELHKSASYQHSISSDINNLIAIKEFKPLLNKFDLGNWIRVKQDDTIYRLRLISYSIDFGAIQTLKTEFSDVTVTANGLNDIQSIIKQASSMATSYSYTQQQAETGAEVKGTYIDDWVANGLNSALIRINNNDDEEINIDSGGISAKTYDDVLDDYDPHQLRITHNVIAFTENNWESVSTALGQFDFSHHQINTSGTDIDLNTNNTIVNESTYGLVAKAVLAGWVVGSYMESSTIIGSHFQSIANTCYIDMDNTKSSDGRANYVLFNNGTEDVFKISKAGNVSIKGEIKATSGFIGSSDTAGWHIADTAIYNTCTSITDNMSSHDSELGTGAGKKSSIYGTYVGVNGIRNQYNWWNTSLSTPAVSRRYVQIYQGTLTANNINALGGTIGSTSTTGSRWQIGSTSIYNTCTTISDDLSSHDSELGPSKTSIYGTFVGINGIRNQYNWYSSGSIYRRYVQIYQGTLTANYINATGGTIGSNGTTSNRWQIGSTSIYNTCTGVDDNMSSHDSELGTASGKKTSIYGTFVGINGIRNQYNYVDTNTSSSTYGQIFRRYVRLAYGTIQANSVDITGKITATSGYIGNGTSGWTITSTYIYNGLNSIYGTDRATMEKSGTCISATYGIRNQHYDGSDWTKTKWCRMADGVLTANSVEITGGTLAGLTVENGEKGLSYNGVISGNDFYFKISAYGGVTCGRYSNNAWQRMDYVTSYGMLKIDYGGTSSSLRGVVATNAGNNTYYDPGSSYAYMVSDGVHVVSDRRSKKDITDLPKTICKNLVLNSRPVRFKYRQSENDEFHYGFIAQEIEEVAPENNSVIEHNVDNDMYSMNYQEMIAPIIKVIQMQQEEIDDLKMRIKGENNG